MFDIKKSRLIIINIYGKKSIGNIYKFTPQEQF